MIDAAGADLSIGPAAQAAIAAITASSLADARGAALLAGANEFLLKPYRETALLAAIGQLIHVSYAASGGQAGRGASEPSDPSAILPLGQLLRGAPAHLRAELREATLAARAERIKELAAQIGAYSPPAQDQISSLADNFQYDEILAELNDAPTV